MFESIRAGSLFQRGFVPAVICLGLIHLPMQGQQTAENPDKGFGELVVRTYGQDQELVNGLQYYNKHPRSMGHPYLMEGWVHQGSVTLRGKLYDGIWLKYNIHAQQVEVEYRTMNGADNQVILVNDRLDEFSIGENLFRKLMLEGTQEQIYQVVGRERMILYIGWWKRLVPVSGDSRFIEEYTPPKRNYLLNLDGTVYPFTNKRSFVRLFPKTIQKEMRKLIRSNHLLIRSAPVKELELFLLVAQDLLEEAGP